MEPVESAANLRSQYLEVLRSRRSPPVPLLKLPAKPVVEPLYQAMPIELVDFKAMKSYPKARINVKELLNEENFYLTTEEGEQGRLPVLILSMKESTQSKRPAVVYLHPSNANKEYLCPLLEVYASRGYIAIAIDARYHGERAKTPTAYQDVWDLIKLADYLTTQRPDIDHSKIGITGNSLGGMHAWFAAFIDTRYSVAVLVNTVQSFRWAIDNDQWQARVDTVKPVFEVARIDLGKEAIDKEVVEKVCSIKIAKSAGLESEFDSPYTVPLIAPRPLLIINGEDDPRCPTKGIDVTIYKTQKAFEDAQCLNHFKVIIEPGIGHEVTSSMLKEVSDWLDKFLKP
ncbi:unnamed protein product [Lactuca virosa]|uniref:Peptidase S9 prolyl oligopeptidase catalytic domain-containing protein n=1 Tax=Lactuca virosa TaxID=75947 RepID=A0AAU9NC51_9ASTR|nr:unnamed protein product [Lactuca virosa]